jgi:SAM-dependent methyltransferase
VTGVDNDGAMLDRARAKWARAQGSGSAGKLTLIEHDLTTLALSTRFDLVFIALNSFLMLDGRAAQERALQVMRGHLAPAGRAVIDVWLPSQEDLELYDGRQVLDWVRTDPETGERIAKSWSATYDAKADEASISTTFEIEDGSRAQRQDRIRFIGAKELLDLAYEAGLKPEQVLGDYDGTAWSAASERVVLIAQGR